MLKCFHFKHAHSTLREAAKKSSYLKARGGGGKALMARPLREEPFFEASLTLAIKTEVVIFNLIVFSIKK